MFKPLNVKKRVVKNEQGPYLWKVDAGFKMSRIAKQVLGIPVDSTAKLNIAYDDETNIIGINLGTKEENNCSVSKMNTITSKEMVNFLCEHGTSFRLSDSKNAEGYYIMEVVDEAITTNTDETIEDELEEVLS